MPLFLPDPYASIWFISCLIATVITCLIMVAYQGEDEYPPELFMKIALGCGAYAIISLMIFIWVLPIAIGAIVGLIFLVRWLGDELLKREKQ